MTLFHSQSALLAVESTGAFRAIEYDLPESPGEWMVCLGVASLLLILGVRVYLRDTAELNRFWRYFLLLLRLSVLAGLVAVALNPQERTQKLAYRPSQVAVLIDRSLSMKFPENQVGPNDSAEESEGASTADNSRTRADAVAELLGKSGMLEELRKNHAVSVYSFDSALNGPHAALRSQDARAVVKSAATSAGGGATSLEETVDWNQIVDPVGLETRLGESLLELIRSISGNSLSGIVVITDGASNSGIDPDKAVEAAKELKARLITVGVGSTRQPVNIQIASVQAPSDVHVGDAFEISAFVQAQGLAGQNAIVELLGRPENSEGDASKLGTKEIVLADDGLPVRVSFEQLENVAGVWEYFVRVRSDQKIVELSEGDNERRKSISVVDRKTRVLVIAGGPMRDYQFVRNMLYRHSAIQTDVWLQTADAAGAVSQEANKILTSFPESKEELFDYDVIVGFDPDWNRLSPEQINLVSEWVFAQAGGLVVVAGDVYSASVASDARLEKIRELYPVVLNRFVTDSAASRAVIQSWPFEFTREGREAGFLQITDEQVSSAEVWKEFQGVYSAYPTSGAKAGATVYAYFSDPRTQSASGLPVLLASQYYGAGRVIYLGSPEMWRMRSIDEVYYDRFWTKSIREAGQARLKRGNNRGTLLLERNQFVLGQTVRVRAQLTDPQFNPLVADSVLAEIFDPDGRPMIPPVRLQRDSNRAGQFVGSFRVSSPGVWRIDIPIPQSGDQLSEKIDVILPNLETDNARQNAQLLRLIAEDTGGTYFPLDEAAAEVPKRLPDRGEEFQIDQQLKTLWDREWLMYLLIGLLSVEWLTRKLLKLA
ncbi:MAG: VWA domain-containing protein [Planctomycetaceae bacterium]|nr:VWA domain-containing protein [Planctomycetaceae bacterium]